MLVASAACGAKHLRAAYERRQPMMHMKTDNLKDAHIADKLIMTDYLQIILGAFGILICFSRAVYSSDALLARHDTTVSPVWTVHLDNTKSTDFAIVPSTNDNLLVACVRTPRDHNGNRTGNDIFECLRITPDGSTQRLFSVDSSIPNQLAPYGGKLPMPRGIAELSKDEFFLLTAGDNYRPWLYHINHAGDVLNRYDIEAAILAHEHDSDKQPSILNPFYSQMQLSSIVRIDSDNFLLFGSRKKKAGKGVDSIVVSIASPATIQWSHSYDLGPQSTPTSSIHQDDSLVIAFNSGEYTFLDSGPISDVRVLKCNHAGDIITEEAFPGRNAILLRAGSQILAVYDRSHKLKHRSMLLRSIFSNDTPSFEVPLHEWSDDTSFSSLQASTFDKNILLIAGTIPPKNRDKAMDYDLILEAYSHDGRMMWGYSQKARPAIANTFRLFVLDKRIYISYSTILKDTMRSGLSIIAFDIISLSD